MIRIDIVANILIFAELKYKILIDYVGGGDIDKKYKNSIIDFSKTNDK